MFEIQTGHPTDKDAFYIFEPLYPWARNGCSVSTQNERIQFLAKMISCDFEDRYDTRIPWEEYAQKNNLSLSEKLDKRGMVDLHFHLVLSLFSFFTIFSYFVFFHV